MAKLNTSLPHHMINPFIWWTEGYIYYIYLQKSADSLIQPKSSG